MTVIGAGFIGSEVAASARTLGREVTIVELEQTPLARALGPEIGALLMGLHREHGTELRLGVHVVEAEGEPVDRLRLSDGATLETDVVIVGIGVVPNIAWLDGSGLELANGVVCDASLRAADGVYAIGDVASWPNELFGRRQRVEHWTNTAEQARHAARNLVHGKRTPFLGSNYVWSDQYGYRIQFVGSTLDAEAEVVAGDPEAREFLAWYREHDRLVGAIGIGLPKLLMQSRTMIEERRNWNDALAALDD